MGSAIRVLREHMRPTDDWPYEQLLGALLKVQWEVCERGL